MEKNKKIVLITGAASGIGKEIALLLSSENTTILAVDQNKKNLQGLGHEIKLSGNICHTYTTNLEKYAEVKKLQENMRAVFSSVDWVVHSAGFFDPHESLFEMNREKVQKTLNANFFSTVYITDLFLKSIKKEGGIIFISSTAGIWGSPHYPIYSASKGAVISFASALAKHPVLESRSSITICPGPTDTPMRRKIIHDRVFRQDPRSVANTVQKIISKKKYKNGDIIIVKNNKDRLYKA